MLDYGFNIASLNKLKNVEKMLKMPYEIEVYMRKRATLSL